ncbi:OmpA family protein [Caminibacter pacificus]
MRKILLGVSLAAAALMAADYQVGAGFGRNAVSNTTMKNYNFLNLRVGKYLPKNHILRVELEKSTSIKIPGVDKDTSLTRALVNVEHYFPIENCKLTPYAFIGGGYQWVKGAYDNAAVADLGLGAKINMTDALGFFVEARGLRDFHNNDNHYGFIGGLTYSFGGEEPKVVPAPAPVKVEKPVVIDSDHDGVSDANDKCPGTPAGVQVDQNGCPIDSDNDGVPNYLDKCPNTPAGVQVDNNGCALDSDHDGVPNYLDKCPNTPKGFKVDKNGCAINYNFEINFDNNSAKIKPQYMPKIEKFAEFLKNHPDVKAEIQGYTDNRGSYKYNVVLSEKRAKAVYDMLIKLGVPADQLTWAGYGPKNPIASNDTAEGRAKNRRVVAKIIY